MITKKRLKDVASLAALILVVTSARSSVADHYRVPSGSMRPTIEVGDRILVNKLAFGLRVPFTHEYLMTFDAPDRGDVVILTSPADGRTLVKRVMGLPGDRVAVRNGRVFVDGEPVPLDAALPLAFGGRDFGPVEISKGAFLVLGDNREGSFDGRAFGLVQADQILGRAAGIYFTAGTLTWKDL